MTNHTKVKIDTKSWDAGYKAGLEGLPDKHGKEIDGYSWSSGYIEGKAEKNIVIDIENVKNAFMTSNTHLFDFILNYQFSQPVSFDRRMNLYCNFTVQFENEIEVTDNHGMYKGVEYAYVYPKKIKKD